MMKFFLKLDRLAAWCLFFCLIIYGFSGYAMLKGIISPALANQVHLHWLGPIALLAFVFHTSFAIHLAFRRWKIWNKFTLVLLIFFYLALAGNLIYFDSFYKPVRLPVTPIRPVASQLVSPADDYVAAATQSSATTEKVFTVAELSQYDGQNGRPAYVAVDGVVYDLSLVFRNGDHHGYSAGQDLGQAFHDQHDPLILDRFPIVGKLK